VANAIRLAAKKKEIPHRFCDADLALLVAWQTSARISLAVSCSRTLVLTALPGLDQPRNSVGEAYFLGGEVAVLACWSCGRR